MQTGPKERQSLEENTLQDPGPPVSFKQYTALVAEVYKCRPYAAPFGKITAAWGEVLFSLQENGFYKNIKSALPTLRKDIRDLIAYKEELGNEKDIAQHLGEIPSQEPKDTSGVGNEQLKCKQFPFSREMVIHY